MGFKYGLHLFSQSKTCRYKLLTALPLSEIPDVRALASSSGNRFCGPFVWCLAVESVAADLSHARQHKSRQGHLYVSHRDIKEHSRRDQVDGNSYQLCCSHIRPH